MIANELARTIAVFQCLIIGKQCFGLEQLLGGSSTAAPPIIGSTQLQYSQVQSLGKSSILGGSSAQLQHSQVQSLGKSSILGGEAELNGSDPICWSSLLELALHLLLAHCTALGPDGVVISSPGPGLAHRDQGESRGCG